MPKKKNVVIIYFNLTLNDKCTLNNYSIKNEGKEKKKIIIITLINSIVDYKSTIITTYQSPLPHHSYLPVLQL